MSDDLSSSQGHREGYDWLETWGLPLAPTTVVHECPEIVLGKRVAVTALDSGPLVLTDREVELGWTMQGRVAISPVVQKVKGLPDADGYDEWYVFDSVPRPGDIKVCTNFPFSLTEERAIAQQSEHLLEGFWRQLKGLNPESYLAWNQDAFLFACRDHGLFERTAAACRELGRIPGPRPGRGRAP